MNNNIKKSVINELKYLKEQIKKNTNSRQRPDTTDYVLQTSLNYKGKKPHSKNR